MAAIVRLLSASGRSRVMVATPSVVADRTAAPAPASDIGRRSAREGLEPSVDQLEQPALDRLVGMAGLLDDELRQQRGELRVVGPQRSSDEEVTLRQTDDDAALRGELPGEVREHVGQQDARRVPALAGLRRQEPPDSDRSSDHGAVADQALRFAIAASWTASVATPQVRR